MVWLTIRSHTNLFTTNVSNFSRTNPSDSEVTEQSSRLEASVHVKILQLREMENEMQLSKITI